MFDVNMGIYPQKGATASAAGDATEETQETSPAVEISAPSAILMEASTGTVDEKDADTPRPPASVTKIMTMLLIFEALERWGYRSSG